MLILWTRNSGSVIDELDLRGRYLVCQLSAQLWVLHSWRFTADISLSGLTSGVFGGHSGMAPSLASHALIFYEVTVNGRLVRRLLLQAQLL